MTKLWEKGYQLDQQMERFTVGEDYLLDRKLIIIVEHHKARGTKYRLVLPGMDSESMDR